MYPPGHIGVGLLMSALLVVGIGPRRSLWVTVLVLLGTQFPDIDLLLPIPHHGVTHTLVGAIVSSVLLGLFVVGLAVLYRSKRGFGVPGAVNLPVLLITSSIAICLGQFSNIAIDLISAPAGKPVPLYPLWPFGVGIVKTRPLMPVHSELWNYGLLLIGCVVFVVAYSRVHREFVSAWP